MTKSQSSYLRYLKKQEDAGAVSWREARYQEILDRNFASKVEKVWDRGNRLGGVIATLRKIFSGPGISGSSATREHSSISMPPEPSVGRKNSELEEYKDSEVGLSTAGAELEPLGCPSSGLARDTWAWVRQLDELTQAMNEGHALFGFVEAPITFPPSFR